LESKVTIMKLKSCFFLAFFAFGICASAQYVEVGPFSGAVTDSSAVVVYKLSLPEQSCRIEYSTDSSLQASSYSEVHTTCGSSANYIKVKLENLEPETTYYYRLELNGETVSRSRGKFQTFSAASRSFKFAFGNSLKSASRRSGLRAALEKDILFFLNTGDLHYDDIDTADIGRFRNSYHKAFLRRDMSHMGRNVPFVYVWDDHDFGPNNSDTTAPGRLESGRAYRECIPHYPLHASEKNGPIYQAFTVNNTRMVMTDLRSMRDTRETPDTREKSMMGEGQLAWFLDEIKESSARYPLVIWVSSVPYTAEPRERGDHWGGFTHERRKIANFLKAHQIDNLMIVSGDAHSVLCNVGTDNNYADGKGEGLFEVLASPLDNWGRSIKGGPWTRAFESDEGQMVYGLLEVDYSEDATTVYFKAFDTEDNLVLEARKSFPAGTSMLP
jgi:phosphodiesterase/alkaline phosphatase D-like protein